jgi:hypothetical protein
VERDLALGLQGARLQVRPGKCRRWWYPCQLTDEGLVYTDEACIAKRSLGPKEQQLGELVESRKLAWEDAAEQQHWYQQRSPEQEQEQELQQEQQEVGQQEQQQEQREDLRALAAHQAAVADAAKPVQLMCAACRMLRACYRICAASGGGDECGCPCTAACFSPGAEGHGGSACICCACDLRSALPAQQLEAAARPAAPPAARGAAGRAEASGYKPNALQRQHLAAYWGQPRPALLARLRMRKQTAAQLLGSAGEAAQLPRA